MMQRLTMAATVLFAVLSGTASVWGQGCPLPLAREQFSDPTNAALVYFQAWVSTPRELTEQVNSEYKREKGWRPSKELSAKLGETPGPVAELLRASQVDGADWGVQWSAGTMALLPHVGLARSSARLLSADARRLLAERKADEAALRVGAMFRLARHITSEPVFICSLVAAVIDADAASAVEAVLEAPGLSAVGRREMLGAARVLDASDPFAMKPALSAERRWCTVWLRERYIDSNKLDELVKELGALAGDDNAEALRTLAGMDKAAARSDLAGMDRFFVEAMAAWDRADARERLEAIEARVKKGEFGVIAGLFVPAIVTCHTRGNDAMQKRGAMLERLRVAAIGTGAP